MMTIKQIILFERFVHSANKTCLSYPLNSVAICVHIFLKHSYFGCNCSPSTRDITATVELKLFTSNPSNILSDHSVQREPRIDTVVYYFFLHVHPCCINSTIVSIGNMTHNP